jgi:hypothetical protein
MSASAKSWPATSTTVRARLPARPEAALKKLLFALSLLLLAVGSGPAWAADQLVAVRPAGGEAFNYVLTARDPAMIAYGLILMPGGNGRLEPRMEGSRVSFIGGGNFLIRSRERFAGPQFAAASTDATSTPGRILAIAQDLQKRYGQIAIYVIGTSRSTGATMSLATSLDGQVEGFIHSSSLSGISGFDTRGLKSRQLIVLHKRDACKVTSPSAGVSNHSKYGTDLIEMDGGKSTGDDCDAFAYHGYNGIEGETVDRMEGWILAGNK